jgi:hypothetical protein
MKKLSLLNGNARQIKIATMRLHPRNTNRSRPIWSQNRRQMMLLTKQSYSHKTALITSIQCDLFHSKNQPQNPLAFTLLPWIKNSSIGLTRFNMKLKLEGLLSTHNKESYKTCILVLRVRMQFNTFKIKIRTGSTKLTCRMSSLGSSKDTCKTPIKTSCPEEDSDSEILSMLVAMWKEDHQKRHTAITTPSAVTRTKEGNTTRQKELGSKNTIKDKGSILATATSRVTPSIPINTTIYPLYKGTSTVGNLTRNIPLGLTKTASREEDNTAEHKSHDCLHFTCQLMK